MNYLMPQSRVIFNICNVYTQRLFNTSSLSVIFNRPFYGVSTGRKIGIRENSKRSLGLSKQHFIMAQSSTSTVTPPKRSFRLALIQLAVTPNKEKNLKNASKLIREAAAGGAQMIALPECFNSPYGIQYFKEYAEDVPCGITSKTIAALARELRVYIVAGSIPELGDEQLFNTCAVFDPTGNLIGAHRKCHLFDIDIPGKITFEESAVLYPGSYISSIDTRYCKIGIGICYDIRFPEMAQIYREEGCELLLYPGAFNMTTGPAHWQLLQQARAVDNQVYVATISPARDENATYVAWGHSMVVSPWGKILTEADEKQAVLFTDIDLDHTAEVRKQIPVFSQRRKDLYRLKKLQTQNAGL